MNRLSLIEEIKLLLESLSVYRGLLEDKVIKAYFCVLEDLTSANIDLSRFIQHYGEFYYLLSAENPEISLEDYLLEKIIYDDNAFSRQSEKLGWADLDANLKKAVERDLNCLQKVTWLSAGELKEEALKRCEPSKLEHAVITSLPEWRTGEHKENNHNENNTNLCYSEITVLWQSFKAGKSWGECGQVLAAFYRHNGCGEFAKYKGFVWERKGQEGLLKGISSPDPVRFRDLIGYERQRQEIINNTEQLLNGYAANNVLLYGDRGTGKSSTVKALLNEYGDSGLRIIELSKSYLNDLPDVLRAIKDRQQKFIIFIDDLTFGDNEEKYTALKAVLEGSLESKPQNVVIYATSNRRHLVKERFSERSGLSSDNPDDEVRSADTLQEKLSLSDRFGITVTYTSPDKEEYLAIVEGLARIRKLDIDVVTLHEEALQWEINHNGRSPRTARQFIDWLEARVAKA